MVNRLPGVELSALTTAGAHQIEHWFDHPEVSNWLGDRSWIHRELRLVGQRPGTTFRGADVLRSYGWLGLDDAGAPVAFIGGDVYDRWIRYDGEGQDGPILSDADHRPALGLGYVVDPERWRHGHGLAALNAVLAHPDVADVEIFFCGIDADNHASRHFATAAGFALPATEPDYESMLYYRRDRSG